MAKKIFNVRKYSKLILFILNGANVCHDEISRLFSISNLHLGKPKGFSFWMLVKTNFLFRFRNEQNFFNLRNEYF